MAGFGGLLLLAIVLVASGLLIGALARWVLPGPDPMSWGRTTLLGMSGAISGAMLGGVAGAMFGSEADRSWLVSLVMSVACAAFFLWYFRRRRRGDRLPDNPR